MLQAVVANVQNILFKNLMDMSIGPLTFFTFGYAVSALYSVTDTTLYFAYGGGGTAPKELWVIRILQLPHSATIIPFSFKMQVAVS